MSVSATTLLTAFWALGALCALLAGRLLGKRGCLSHRWQRVDGWIGCLSSGDLCWTLPRHPFFIGADYRIWRQVICHRNAHSGDDDARSGNSWARFGAWRMGWRTSHRGRIINSSRRNATRLDQFACHERSNGRGARHANNGIFFCLPQRDRLAVLSACRAGPSGPSTAARIFRVKESSTHWAC